MLVTMLEQMGITKERYNLTWVSSAEPDKFAKAVTDFTNQVKKLGPIKTITSADAV